MVTAWGCTISDEALHLCAMMLRENPNERYSVEEIIEHPWLSWCHDSDSEDERMLMNYIFSSLTCDSSVSNSVDEGSGIEENTHGEVHVGTPGLMLLNDSNGGTMGESVPSRSSAIPLRASSSTAVTVVSSTASSSES